MVLGFTPVLTYRLLVAESGFLPLPSRREGAADRYARSQQCGLRRSISASSRAASSALTSTIGRRTSALSISPLRASQYFAGAGLGSANSSRVSSAMALPARQRAVAVAFLHAASAPLRRPRSRDAPTAGSRRRRRRRARRDTARPRRSARESPAGRRRSRSIDCARSAPQSFMPTMFGCSASCSSVSLVEVDAGPVGDVVEHDRPGGVIGERGEMLQQAALRGPDVIGARDQIAVDRPGRRLIQRIQHLRGAGARQPETDRQCSARWRIARRAPPCTSRSSSAMPSAMPSPEVAARIKPSTGPAA